MYSAPPQYHVRGAAVNLVLKGYKAGEGGLQGEVNGNYVQKDEAGGNGGVTLAWLSPRWDVDAMYHLSDYYYRQGMDFRALHTTETDPYLPRRRHLQAHGGRPPQPQLYRKPQARREIDGRRMGQRDGLAQRQAERYAAA